MTPPAGENAAQPGRPPTPRQLHPNEYAIWVGMRQRCANGRSREYRYYGGRGITVCPHWLGPDGFRSFLKDLGPQPFPRASINRLDNDGPYEPGNVRWADPKAQARNMSTNRHLAHGGACRILVAWAEQQGIKPGTLSARLARGWSVARALTQPVAPRQPFRSWAPRTQARCRAQRPAAGA